tara:strand:+ start:571 stop:798 length:228 start_codon:yes stop_codon:yes gene_type:complete
MDEAQKYWDDLRVMMLTDGWKALIEELSEKAVVVDSVLQARDEADLHFRKGQLNIIFSLTGLEDSIEQAEAQAND